MFIVSGTKIKKRRVGLVADYCPICQVGQGCDVVEIRAAGHLYGVSLGRGKLVGQEICCRCCKNSWGTEIEAFRDIANKKDTHLELAELVGITNPGLPKRIQSIMEVEERMRLGSATTDERRSLLAGPLMPFNAELEQRLSEMHFDGLSAFWMFLTIALPVYIVFSSPFKVMTSEEINNYIGMGVGGVCFAILVYLVATDGSRFCRRVIMPRVVPALANLQPSLSDIKDVLAFLSRRGAAIGKKMKAESLFEAIQKHL